MSSSDVNVVSHDSNVCSIKTAIYCKSMFIQDIQFSMTTNGPYQFGGGSNFMAGVFQVKSRQSFHNNNNYNYNYNYNSVLEEQ